MAGARGGTQSQAQDKDHQLCEVGAALIRIQAADTYQALKLPVKGAFMREYREANGRPLPFKYVKW